MPKNPSPIPPIVPLTGLVSAYCAMKGMPRPDRVTESHYITTLSNYLITDGVLDNKGSKNFVTSLKGRPYESNSEQAPGLDTKRLDKIALQIIDHYKFREFFKLPETITFPWNVFCELIFPTPLTLKSLNDYKYYKFLPIDGKQAVDQFVNRRLNELGIVKGSIINYSVYMWNTDYRHVRCAVLTIDPEEKTATYSYFAPVKEGFAVKSSMRAVNYSLGSSILFLDLTEEDPDKQFIRADMLITILDAQFTNLSILKAILTVAGHNGTTPVSCEAILEKCDSYFDAYDRVVNDAKKDPLLCLEVQNRRFELNRANISEPEKLRSYKLYQTLLDLEGHYLFCFLTKQGALIGPGLFSTACCHISPNGMVRFRFHNSHGILSAYVNQAIERDSKFICIDYFLTNSSDLYDSQYRLEIERDYRHGGAVRALFGAFIGFVFGTVLKNDVVLIKLDTKIKGPTPTEKYEYEMHYPLYESFDEAFKDYVDKQPRPVNDLTGRSPAELDGIRILGEKRHDH